MLDCTELAVPLEVMRHVVSVESARNPFAIGVVGGRLSRQPRNLEEALSAVQALKDQGYNFSVGIAQVNRYNLVRYGLSSYVQAFEVCPNLRAGAQILRECHDRAGDWGRAFSCYYSGNFVTGFEHGYVQKVFDAMERSSSSGQRVADITVIPRAGRADRPPARDDGVPITRGPAALAQRMPATTAAVATAAQAPVIPPASPRPALADVPVQAVGARGDPYRVQVLPARTTGQDRKPVPSGSTPPAAVDRSFVF